MKEVGISDPGKNASSGRACEGGGIRSRLSRPPDEARWCPVEVGAVRDGLVARIGRVSALPVAADVGHHAPVPVEDLDGGRGDLDLDVPAGKRVGDAARTAIDLNVIVHVHVRLAPLGVLVALSPKRLERWPVQILEEAAAAVLDLLAMPSDAAISRWLRPSSYFTRSNSRILRKDNLFLLVARGSRRGGRGRRYSGFSNTPTRSLQGDRHGMESLIEMHRSQQSISRPVAPPDSMRPVASSALDSPLILRYQRMGTLTGAAIGRRNPRSESRMRNLIGANRSPPPGVPRRTQPDPGLP